MSLLENRERFGCRSFNPELASLLDKAALPPPLRTREANCLLVEISGTTMGVGKSRARQALATMLSWSLGIAEAVVHSQSERYQENPFLPNPKQRFQSELWFLNLKAEDNQKASEFPRRRLFLQDVPPDCDYLFAIVDAALNSISLNQLEHYRRSYEATARRMVKPDLIVFLDCSDGIALQRVQERDRDWEQTPAQQERLLALAHLSRRWRREREGDLSFLDIDSAVLNFNDDNNGQKELADLVARKLNEIAAPKLTRL